MVTKNLNCGFEIPIYLLLIDRTCCKAKKTNIMGFPKKIQFLGEVTQKMYRGIAYKGGLGQFAGLTGYLAKKRRAVFLRGRLIPQ